MITRQNQSKSISNMTRGKSTRKFGQDITNCYKI